MSNTSKTYSLYEGIKCCGAILRWDLCCQFDGVWDMAEVYIFKHKLNLYIERNTSKKAIASL